MLFSERPPIYALLFVTISGERTEQLDIFCRVTGFTSDFLSFIVVELIRFFHRAIQLFNLRWHLVSSVLGSVGWATERHPACKKLGFGLFVVTIWLEGYNVCVLLLLLGCVLLLHLSPPPPSSLEWLKPGNVCVWFSSRSGYRPFITPPPALWY